MARQGGIGPWGNYLRSEGPQVPRREPFPGANMPGGDEPGPGGWASNPNAGSEQAPPEEQQGPTEAPTPGGRPSFGQRMFSGAGAWATAHNEKYPDPFSRPPQTPLEHGVYGFGGSGALMGMRMFQGNRTTPNPSSEAAEQNIYGGVQRDIIPTRRISISQKGMQGQGEGFARERLNKEAYESQVYPMTQRSAPMQMQQGSPMQMRQPVGGYAGPAGQPGEDPLFANNTGQVPYNQAQFGNVHQRQVSGAPKQQQ